MKDVFVSFCTTEFSFSVHCANLWSQKLNVFGFPQWKVLVCCICHVSSCRNVLLFILHLKDCHEKINFCPWEKENFFSVFFTVCVQVISNEHWKRQNHFKSGNEWEGFGSDFFSGTDRHSLYVFSSYTVQEPVSVNNNTTSDPFCSNLNQ